jgi:hypothetical protein
VCALVLNASVVLGTMIFEEMFISSSGLCCSSFGDPRHRIREVAVARFRVDLCLDAFFSV